MVLCTGCQGPVSEKRGRAVHCNILGGKGCLACKEDIALEQKIQELQERHLMLRTNMNASHDPFILKLPPEIASYIFLLSMGEWDTCEIPSEGNCLPMPFLLGAICSGWRQLARSTPALWTRLAFTLSRASKVMRALPDLIADWLQRSGGLPLTLGVSSCTIYSDPPRDRHVSVIDALNQHSGRWSQVEFKLPPNYVSHLCGSSPPKYLRNLR